jgi:trigger factor
MTAIEEMTNEDVQVIVHRKPACKIELDVKASPSLIEQARKAAIKQVSKEVSLPGFRKGRAPDEMILQNYPKDVERTLNKSLADLAFISAQKLVKIPLLNNNSKITFDMKKMSDKGAEMLFAFETEPKIPSVDPKEFVEKPIERAEVGEKQIDEAIRQMLFFYAQWTPVEDRVVKEGDYIMINLDTVEGDVVQNVFHNIRFEVSAQRMANWMKKLVLNAKAGDVLEGMSEPDDTATEEELKEFKPKKVRLTLLKVEEATLPELNDEFAKKVGASDVAHMRKTITEMLNKQADEKVLQDKREQVSEFLAQNYPFELPQSLIDAERNHRMQQMMNDPKSKAAWQKMSVEEKAKWERNIEDESAQAVRLFYISRNIVQGAKIPVTHKEVQDEALALIQSHGIRNADVDKIPKEVYALSLSKVILSKAQDYIIDSKK